MSVKIHPVIKFDILLGGSFILQFSVILTIESHLQGKYKKDKFTILTSSDVSLEVINPCFVYNSK